MTELTDAIDELMEQNNYSLGLAKKRKDSTSESLYTLFLVDLQYIKEIHLKKENGNL